MNTECDMYMDRDYLGEVYEDSHVFGKPVNMVSFSWCLSSLLSIEHIHVDIQYRSKFLFGFSY